MKRGWKEKLGFGDCEVPRNERGARRKRKKYIFNPK